MKNSSTLYAFVLTLIVIISSCSKDGAVSLKADSETNESENDSTAINPIDTIMVSQNDSLPFNPIDSIPVVTPVDSIPTTNPKPANSVKLIIIGGQSLSVGTGAGGVVTNTPISEAFMLDYSSLSNDIMGPKATTLNQTTLQGILPLQEVNVETQASGIAHSVLNLIGGKVLVISFGAGGQLINTLLGEPYQGNMKKMVKDAVSEAQKMGWQVDNKPLFVWEQGQADSNTNIDIYKQKLGQMIRNVNLAVKNELGTSQLYTVVAQARVYSHMKTAIAQLEFTEATPFVALGGVETAYQMRWPASQSDNTHLNAMGYRKLGEKNGEKGALLILGNEDKPALMSSYSVNGNIVTLKFKNVDSSLSIDAELFSAFPTENPSEFGFGTFNLNGNKGNGVPQILNIVQKDSDEFILTMNHMNQKFQLWLGRQPNDNVAGSNIIDGPDDMIPVHWIEIQ